MRKKKDRKKRKKRKDPLADILPPDFAPHSLRWNYLLDIGDLQKTKQGRSVWRRVKLLYLVTELVWHRYCAHFHKTPTLSPLEFNSIEDKVVRLQTKLKLTPWDPEEKRYRKKWDKLVRSIADTATFGIMYGPKA